MHSLTLLAGAMAASLVAGSAIRPPEPDTNGTESLAAALPVYSESLSGMPVLDRTGAAQGLVVDVLRMPDQSVTALVIAWTGPDGMSGMTIEHPVQFLDFQPETQRVIARQSWAELQSGYRSARAAPDPVPPRTGMSA